MCCHVLPYPTPITTKMVKNMPAPLPKPGKLDVFFTAPYRNFSSILFLGFENTKLFGSTNTGLSQSDLSICSQGSVNPSYRYGNQLEYDAGHFGYAIYDSDSQSRKLEGSSKWVEFDKSPDTEKTLLTDFKLPSIEKDISDNVRNKAQLII